MHEIIQQMLSAYITVFDAYPISPENQQLVDDFKKRLSEFGERYIDVSNFSSEFMTSGLQEEYTTIITKVVMDGYNMPTSEKNEETQVNTPNPVVSVKNFVEQYRSAYQAVCDSGYRKRAETAYKAIFAVAERTQDMLTAQTILETERLLWNIIPTDALDIFEPILEVMDPLFAEVRVALELQCSANRKASCAEELTYLLENQDYQRMLIVNKGTQRITVAGFISTMLFNYGAAIQAIYDWKADILAQNGVRSMIVLRNAIRRTLTFAKSHLGLSFDDILNEEAIKIWLLAPQTADTFSRIKTTLHPQNLLAIKRIITEDILPDQDIVDILLRKPTLTLWGDLPEPKGSQYRKRASAKAATLNSAFSYYQNRDKMGGVAQQHENTAKAIIDKRKN